METLVDTRQTCEATQNGTNSTYAGYEDDITIPNYGHSTFDQALGRKKTMHKELVNLWLSTGQHDLYMEERVPAIDTYVFRNK